MPLQNTSGSDTTDAYGGGAAAVPNYIENVFSTYLYTGNGSTQSINNGIDLSTKGGLVWTKNRATGTASSPPYTNSDHGLYDTVRGVAKYLSSNGTGAQVDFGTGGGLQSFTSTGFSVKDDSAGGFGINGSLYQNSSPVLTYASWTFRKQPKFFDIQTFTANSSGNATFNHNLQSTPGCIIYKRTDGVGSWFVWHKDLNGGVNSGQYYIYLERTNGTYNLGVNWITPSSTNVAITTGAQLQPNAQYVAYLFAHNAGGFGLTGTDNVITCGSFTTDGSGNATVSLGYEPQWVMIKTTDNVDNWMIADNMRGMSQTGDNYLTANSSYQEVSYNYLAPTATGFQIKNLNASWNYIYIAIRKGPMAVPTTGTSVYYPLTRTGTRAAGSITGVGFPPDSLMTLNRTPGGYQPEWNNKLVGSTYYLKTATTTAETYSTDLKSYDEDGVSFNATDYNSIVNLTSPLIQYFFKRAPSVFDVVCYTGTTSDNTQNHNLTVIPELIIFKRRNAASSWGVFSNFTSTQLTRTFIADNPATTYLYTDGTGIAAQPTTTQIVLTGGNSFTNVNGGTYVAYLFATCPGVSKVGNYTGNGSTQAISCGFTGGARFVLIHRQDSGGSSWPWYVYDTARGMTTLTDPYILLDSTSAETATLGSVTTTTGGFTVNASILSAINTNAASYIFIAIS